MNKNELRKHSKNIRNTFPDEFIKNTSKLIINELINDNNFKNSNNIGIYYPIKNEIDLLELITLYPNKNFYFPFITNNNEMYFKLVKSLENLNFSKKIPEPFIHNETINKNDLELIIVPALAYDKNNHRIGYGKGYYDRYLKDYLNIKIGVTYKDLYYENVYPDFYDIKVDYVIVK